LEVIVLLLLAALLFAGAVVCWRDRRIRAQRIPTILGVAGGAVLMAWLMGAPALLANPEQASTPAQASVLTGLGALAPIWNVGLVVIPLLVLFELWLWRRQGARPLHLLGATVVGGLMALFPLLGTPLDRMWTSPASQQVFQIPAPAGTDSMDQFLALVGRGGPLLVVVPALLVGGLLLARAAGLGRKARGGRPGVVGGPGQQHRRAA
jgi:hypothetical protein